MIRSVLLLLCFTGSALADNDEPPAPPPPAVETQADKHVYVSGGTLLTIDHFLNAALVAEGGVRIPNSPLVVHVSGATGGSLDADNGGDFKRITGGLGIRSCGGTRQCMFIDVGLGYQRQTWNPSDPEESELHRGGLFGGRAGVDVGGEHVRFRATFELYMYRREFVDHMTTAQKGGGITLGLAYRI